MGMQNILDRYCLKLRRYRDSDLDKIEKLLITHHEATRIPSRKLIFDWIASHNPAAGYDKCYMVIEDNEKIIAYEGRMPVDFIVNGEKERGYFFHDTLVHPEYRKKGLGLTSVNSLKSAWEEATNSLAVAIWMNEFTHEILIRRGYYQLNAHCFVRPVNLSSLLIRVVKNKLLAQVIAPFAHSCISLYDFFISRRRYQGISISRIERFDQHFDEFIDRISKKFLLIVLRHSKYLNWKYIDKPSANHTIFIAERDGKLSGYIVLMSRTPGNIKVGTIVDILADPDDSLIIGSLCQAAINFFRKENVDSIRCVLTNKNFIRIFKRNLFFENRRTFPVMIWNLDKHSARKLIKNIDNWFLTFGDSDAVVWQ